MLKSPCQQMNPEWLGKGAIMTEIQPVAIKEQERDVKITTE